MRQNFVEEVNVPYQTLEEVLEEARRAGVPEQRILDLKNYYLMPPPEGVEVNEVTMEDSDIGDVSSLPRSRT
jgi:hypothetical protein